MKCKLENSEMENISSQTQWFSESYTARTSLTLRAFIIKEDRYKIKQLCSSVLTNSQRTRSIKRNKDTLKIKTIENKYYVERVHKSESWFLEMASKIDDPFAIMTAAKKKKI